MEISGYKGYRIQIEPRMSIKKWDVTIYKGKYTVHQFMRPFKGNSINEVSNTAFKWIQKNSSSKRVKRFLK